MAAPTSSPDRPPGPAHDQAMAASPSSMPAPRASSSRSTKPAPTARCCSADRSSAWVLNCICARHQRLPAIPWPEKPLGPVAASTIAAPPTEIIALGRQLLAGLAGAGVRPSRGPWRRRLRRAGAHRCRRPGQARPPGAAGAAAPAAQPCARSRPSPAAAPIFRRSPASIRRSIAASAACRAGLRPAARAHAHAGVRRYGVPRPVVRLHRERAWHEIGARDRTIAPDHRPSRQRRQPVRRRRTARASPARWASPPSTA